MITTIKNIINGVYRAIFKGDKYFRYSILTRIINFIYPKMIHTEYGKIFLTDKFFLSYFKKFEGNNYNSFDRKYTLLQFLKLIKNLKGDTVECGVFKGATSYLILKNIDKNKKHHIFDSFEGLSLPKSIDGTHWQKNSLSCSLDYVKKNLSDFENVAYHKGWIPYKFEDVKDVIFSFVHIDVDLYQPTKDSLDFFYSRLEKGGIIICDDYGFSTCPGAKKAVDEFILKEGIDLLDLTTGQAIIIKNE